MAFFKKKMDQPQFYATVGEGLKKIYKGKLLPLEDAYDFHEFVSPALNDPDFDAKPMILFVGQYSTGKTSLIRYLLEKDYPGLRIGPEPTTDTFNVVMYGDQDQIIPGNALGMFFITVNLSLLKQSFENVYIPVITAINHAKKF